MPLFESTAVSYAKCAERLLGDDANFLNNNPDLVPQFINALFQSLEVSLKEVGNQSGLTTHAETIGGREGLVGNGHDIEKLGHLVKDRLGLTSPYHLVRLLTVGIQNPMSEIIFKMIFGDEFEATRESYRKRKLVYHAELEEGDIQVVNGVKPWADTVRAVAENIDNAVTLVTQWQESASEQTFAEWHLHESSYIIR